MAEEKSVRIMEEVFRYSYTPEPKVDHDFETARNIDYRSKLEKLVFANPENELESFRRMIATWKECDTCIVFGNLGRQPHLLNYYLDLCFTHNETVTVYCKWKLPSPYQTHNPKTDFLIFVEPAFGETVQKPPNVKHLIVLTSHLAFEVMDPNLKTYFFHLSNQQLIGPTTPLLRNYEKIKPPIFHKQPAGDLPDKVMLDVSKVNTSHEAYLKLLTGREMINNRPYQIVMKNRQRLHNLLKLSKEKLERLYVTGKLLGMKWQWDRIYNMYFEHI